MPTKEDALERVNAADFFFKKMKTAKKREYQNYYFWACLNTLYTSWNYIKCLNVQFYDKYKNDPKITHWISKKKGNTIRGLDVHKEPKKLGKNYRAPKKIPPPKIIQANGRAITFYSIQLQEKDAEYYVGPDRTREIKRELKELILLFRNALSQ
ncbi:MAG: hypothetical protein PHD95_01480 [Candidatus ainarchaeum sp.]|nr:hypothetical protein [Candidatus ainarchaeum sp.]